MKFEVRVEGEEFTPALNFPMLPESTALIVTEVRFDAKQNCYVSSNAVEVPDLRALIELLVDNNMFATISCADSFHPIINFRKES